ncbi:MAG: trypsin-like serine protease [Bacteroidota bacterium]|nr:trypsin-like serine protease [Bacteroidota bacterium]
MLSTLFFALSFFSLTIKPLPAQISYGGRPLPLSVGVSARTIDPAATLFVEMPSFDQEAALRRAQTDQAKLKSLEFAHKFDVQLRPENSGVTFSHAGMNVWRVGIRSKGAYSINLLFSKFRLPEGAKVFIYNTHQTEVLGAYTHENNSDLNLLPVQPIGGEELIVEYQVPLHSTDKGEIEIGDVNHDFLGLFRGREPRDPQQSCHPNIVCYPEDIQPGSGVVALIINGTYYCTGSLINNTAEDGTPYLLTATHCLNFDYSASFLANRRYDLMAGNIVAFFNYQSPLCDTDIRGPLQMTMASADSVLISERHDISLLKLKQMPPAEYQPYYLGWNANANAGNSQSGPFHGLHHPNGGVKKVAVEENSLSFGSFDDPKYNMEPNSFWIVKAWDVAATEAGSSGSPLLDREKKVIGTLTGGSSMCGSPKGPDIYASLHKFWEVDSSLNNPNRLSYYLDPEGLGVTQLNGYNPYTDDPYTRSQNFGTDETAIASYFQSVPLFATNNTYGYTEFAEEFQAKGSQSLQGLFIASPATSAFKNLDIRIRVYTGENGPERLLYELPFNCSYQYYSSGGFHLTERNMGHSVENYVEFPSPLQVTNSFYIAYHETKGQPGGFSVYNAEPRKIGSEKVSTAWMKNGGGWVRSSENIENPMNTSLLIAPYVIGEGSVVVKPDKLDSDLRAYYSREVQRIFIESNNDLLEWEIFHTSGIKVHQESADISMNRVSYQASHLPKGVYIVKVRTVGSVETTKKVLVN